MTVSIMYVNCIMYVSCLGGHQPTSHPLQPCSHFSRNSARALGLDTREPGWWWCWGGHATCSCKHGADRGSGPAASSAIAVSWRIVIMQESRRQERGSNNGMGARHLTRPCLAIPTGDKTCRQCLTMCGMRSTLLREGVYQTNGICVL